jgi:hypothetical protein
MKTCASNMSLKLTSICSNRCSAALKSGKLPRRRSLRLSTGDESALERLRATFNDELLVRDSGKFERTPRADRLLAELRDPMPRLETALRRDRFDPLTSRSFRVLIRCPLSGYAQVV